jgi:hypothetical protein
MPFMPDRELLRFSDVHEDGFHAIAVGLLAYARQQDSDRQWAVVYSTVKDEVVGLNLAAGESGDALSKLFPVLAPHYFSEKILSG